MEMTAVPTIFNFKRKPIICLIRIILLHQTNFLYLLNMFY